MADLSLGILIDILDDEWMRDTLPDDGTSPFRNVFFFSFVYGLVIVVILGVSHFHCWCFFSLSSLICLFLLQISHCLPCLLRGPMTLKIQVCSFSNLSACLIATMLHFIWYMPIQFELSVNVEILGLHLGWRKVIGAKNAPQCLRKNSKLFNVSVLHKY